MIDLFLDCGAFTVANKGGSINIKKYHQFCKKHHKNFNIIASLDDINSWEKSLANFEKLEPIGNYMPCFHQGEPFKLLSKYLEMSDVVALGGMVGCSGSKLSPWIKSCFKIVKEYKDKHIHGFGLTDQKIMFSNPWTSIDSATWIRTSRMGIILIPRYKYGKVDYASPPRRIQVSDKGAHKNSQYSHIDNLSNIERNKVLQVIDESGYEMGESKYTHNKVIFGKNKEKPQIEVVIKGLCNDYSVRDLFNLCYMQKLEKVWGSKIYLAGMGAKEDELLKVTKSNKSEFRRLVSFAYMPELKKLMKLKEEKSGKKRTFKRLNRSKTRSSK